MTQAISLSGVTKTFGKKLAVDRVDLVVPPGSLCGFIGPNGAGKTTIIRMVMSILFPDRGEISVLGRSSALDAKDDIGYLPEERGVYRKMKVGAFLSYVAGLKGADGPNLGRKIRDWLGRVGLADVVSKPCEELSKGMQQKVQFLASVLHEPDLLILDEPFSGLDPVSMRMLRDLILEQHARGATVVFSTHVMHQAEELCDHLVMIHEGRKVLDDSLDRIRDRFDTGVIELEPLDGEAEPASALDASLVREVERNGRVWRIGLAEGVDPQPAMRTLLDAVPARRVELHRPSLEDIFVGIVAGEAAGREEVRASLRNPVAAEVER